MAGSASFEIAVPCWLPPGFGFGNRQPVMRGNDLLSYELSNPTGTWCEISQRARWLSLAEELSTARVPFTEVRLHGRSLFVVHGVYGGEPIDHTFWSSTRRSVAVERPDSIVEVRAVSGAGPNLRGLLRVAAGMAGPPS